MKQINYNGKNEWKLAPATPPLRFHSFHRKDKKMNNFAFSLRSHYTQKGILPPKISVVGKDASLAVFLVIQHANLKYQKKFLPILENAIKRNEANKSYYAYLVDRINICENKKQIYGTQLEYNFKTKSYYFNYNTIIDPKNIDKRRAEMGLNSIEEYLKTWNLKWMPPK